MGSALHYLKVRPEDGQYRAYCQCGWEGKRKRSKSAAERDWRRKHPNMPRWYA